MIRGSQWRITWNPWSEDSREILAIGDAMDRDVSMPRRQLVDVGAPDFAAGGIPVGRGNRSGRLDFDRRLPHETAAESWEVCSAAVAADPWGKVGVLEIQPQSGVARYYRAALANSTHQPAADSAWAESVHSWSWRIAPLASITLPGGITILGGRYNPAEGYVVPTLPPEVALPPGTVVQVGNTPGLPDGWYETGGGGLPAGGSGTVPVEQTSEPEPIESPVNTAAPVISGTSSPGGLLTAAAGTWVEADSVTRMWFLNGVATGQTAASYLVPLSAQNGWPVRLRETATNGGGVTTAWSNELTVFAPPINTALPVIAGDGEPGAELTLTTPGTWEDADLGVTGEWMLNATPTGQTGTTYEIPLEAEAGDTIRYRETATNGAGTTDAYSNAITVAGEYDDSPMSVPPGPVWMAIQFGNPQYWIGRRIITMALEWEALPTGYTIEIIDSADGHTSGELAADVPGSVEFETTLIPRLDFAFTYDSATRNDFLANAVNGLDVAAGDTAHDETIHYDSPFWGGVESAWFRIGLPFSHQVKVRSSMGGTVVATATFSPRFTTTVEMRSTASAEETEASDRTVRMTAALELLTPSNFA